MVHTFVAENEDELNAIGRPALGGYLDVNLDLTLGLMAELGTGPAAHEAMTADDRAFVKERAIDQFLKESGFIVLEKDAPARAAEIHETGIDEIACLIDFGIPHEHVLRSLKRIAKLIAAPA
jgi:hypothetical protein